MLVLMVLTGFQAREYFVSQCVNCGIQIILSWKPAPGDRLVGEQADACCQVSSFTFQDEHGVEKTVTVDTLANYRVCSCGCVCHEYCHRRVVQQTLWVVTILWDPVSFLSIRFPGFLALSYCLLVFEHCQCQRNFFKLCVQSPSTSVALATVAVLLV